MKRTFLVLFLLSALCSAYAQTITIHVSGHVTYDNGTPVEGTPVAIYTDSLMGFFYYNEVPTDPDGFYEDWIEVPATLTQGTLFVTVWDCPWGPGGANLQLLSWFPNHTDLVADFTCPSQPLCSVTIEAQPNPNGVTTLEALPQGTQPYTYLWSNGYVSPSISVQGSGTWCVTVTDSIDCVATACHTIGTDSSDCGLQLDVLPDVIIANAWGAEPITYLWSDGSTEPVLMPNGQGTYCLTITDATGCSAEACTWFTPGIGNDSCMVQIEVVQNGTWLDATICGCASQVSFQWSTGDTTQAIPIDTGLSQYCVTITSPGCEATDCIDLDDLNCGVTIAAQPGANVMTAIATGVPPFSYFWNTGETTGTIQLDSAGVYCVTVTDALGCATTDCTYWGTPGPCTVMAQLDTIWGSDSVYLWASASGGQPPYTFQWIAPDGTVYAGVDVVTDQEGEWCVVMTDAAGCSALDCITPFTDGCTAEIYPDPDCISLFAWSTGPLPHSYQWSTGNTEAVIFPLFADEYCVTITDAEGCVAETCVWFDPAGCSDTCQVEIEVVQNGTWLTADVGGSPGLTSFEWSNGATAQSIPIDPNQSSYCVTITTPTGCVATDCIDLMGCSVEILMTPNTNGLFAAASGIPPFSYQWNTGATDDVIFPDEPGTYCVTVTDAVGCTAEACMELFPPEPCHVSLTVNDTIIMNGAWLWAMGSGGVPPYTFEWIAPNGDVFQGSDLLSADQEGEWCVVLTDFLGCTDTACVWVDLPDCWVDIAVVQDMGALWLEAVPAGTPPFTFSWSTGDTAQIIPYPVQSDVSVTVTDAAGCTATSSVVTGTPQIDFGVQGWVYTADSINWPIYIPGRAELWRWNDTDSLVLVDTVPLGMTLNAPHYDFGDQALGLYLVRIIPYDTTLLPTYHFHALEWQEAWPIEVPTFGASYSYDVYLFAATPLDGPGSIEGYVGAADGFRPGDEPESDEPLAGATLLLYDAAGEPLQWRATSATGHFRFDGLPWGTYELVLEIPGREQARQWITLGPDQPVVQVTFEVGNDGTTVTEAEEVATAAIVRLSPNPTSGLLRLEMALPQAGPVWLRIFDPTGRMLWQDRQMAPSGTQVWTIAAGQHLPKGIYFLQVATETDMHTLRFVKQ